MCPEIGDDLSHGSGSSDGSSPEVSDDLRDEFDPPDGSSPEVSDDLRDVFDPPDDSEEVVETDFVPGGWDAWDLCSPGPRRVAPPQTATSLVDEARQVADLLALVVAEMMVVWRTDRGLRQSDAAAQLGVTQSWLSRVERRQAAVGIELLTRLASVTGSDVSIRMVPEPAGRPVRWLARSGRVGRATVQFAVAGPEERAPGPIF